MSSQHVLGTLGGRGKWAAGNMDLEVRRGAQVGDPPQACGLLVDQFAFRRKTSGHDGSDMRGQERRAGTKACISCLGTWLGVVGFTVTDEEEKWPRGVMVGVRFWLVSRVSKGADS